MKTMIPNIISGKTGDIYTNIIDTVTLDKKPHKTFNSIWSTYENSTVMSNNLNGRIFEYAICEIFRQYKVGILYYQCKLWSMPHDQFDIVGWVKQAHPIIISCKTSLRERWKQAEMEGRLLKGIFPNTKSYLVTNNENEALAHDDRISRGSSLGIDDVYVARQPKFDDLVLNLCNMDLIESTPIPPLSGTRI